MYSSEATARARAAASATTDAPSSLSLKSPCLVNGKNNLKGKLPSKVYVGHLPYNVAKRELDDLFVTYGKILSIEIKHGGYAFVQYGLLSVMCLASLFSVPFHMKTQKDADEAVLALNNHSFDGRRLLVEFSNKRDSVGNSCLLCGNEGHWARDCPDNKERGADVKSGKCFKCGSFGHLARFCRGPDTGSMVGVPVTVRDQGYPSKSSYRHLGFRSRSRSRSKSRSRSRSRSPIYKHSRSRSFSRSPSPRRRARSPPPLSHPVSRHHRDDPRYDGPRNHYSPLSRCAPHPNSTTPSSIVNVKRVSGNAGHGIGGMIGSVNEHMYDEQDDYRYMERPSDWPYFRGGYNRYDDGYYPYQSDHRDYSPEYHRDNRYLDERDTKGRHHHADYIEYYDARDRRTSPSPRSYDRYMAEVNDKHAGYGAPSGDNGAAIAESPLVNPRLADSRHIPNSRVQEGIKHDDPRLVLHDPRLKDAISPHDIRPHDPRHYDPRLHDARTHDPRLYGARDLDRSATHTADIRTADPRLYHEHKNVSESTLEVRSRIR
ncbi:hypothetical protein BATDEDRAFT_85071 [Batrachochytrium dendrobatidis JAM81]|uniref:Uncharacterized protein n=2 Tax=Batrachochytrium dendrobatidis TaxID=109871 RepID=F4NTM5_BATDJ|nr:uncharacterized protein BATDEDRAFT_85071 [Batrachochytrium dendrobatidis JAM81]EGF84350.1 hypothetical protein BATDEDRAFT_85071 [Batrachochytrium dendrobatidis JAM81]|eukprot:XP_006676413.1 hypothetical protein BATDEDRAFT_85071 [Batrachochytrium dendrobatidis JAM81]